MTIDAEYEVKGGKLFSVSGSEVDPSLFKEYSASELLTLREEDRDVSDVMAEGDMSFDSAVPSEGQIVKILVQYEHVAEYPEEYDEAFLANLRSLLKLMEDEGLHALIVPVAKNYAFADMDACEDFTAAFKHLARRVKDCTNVIGLALPEGFVSGSENVEEINYFVSELTAKHDHYVFAGGEKIFEILGKCDGDVQSRTFKY